MRDRHDLTRTQRELVNTFIAEIREREPIRQLALHLEAERLSELALFEARLLAGRYDNHESEGGQMSDTTDQLATDQD